MEVSVKTEGDICVVSVLDSRIDAAVALEFKETMRRTAQDSPMKHLAPKQSLILAGMTPTVDKVFKLTRMDSVFVIFPTLDAALGMQRA